MFNIYLLSLKINGFKNICKEIKLEFYKKNVDKKFDPREYHIKGIYGENGSGKTAIVTAVYVLKNLLINQRFLSDSVNQFFLKELLNKTMNDMNMECEVLLRYKDKNYIFKYSINLNKNADDVFEINSEQMWSKSGDYVNDRYKSVYFIQNGKIIESQILDENIKQRTMNLLSSKSLVSSIFEMSVSSDKPAESVSKYFAGMIVFGARIQTFLDESDQHGDYLYQKGIELIQAGEDIGDINRFLSNIYQRKTDAIGSKIPKRLFGKYKERVQKLSEFLIIFKPDLKGIIIEKKEDRIWYRCNLLLDYGKYRIPTEFESTGIKKLIRIFNCLSAVANGGIAFVDELDSNINDVYLCKMIEYFLHYTDGQLIFTTHNVSVMGALKEAKKSIDFLSSINTIHSWTSRGNAAPDKWYRNGLIDDIPFNIEATDYLGVFEGE